MSRLITKLLKTLQRGGVVDAEEGRVRASVFEKLLSVNTIRAETDAAFLMFGKSIIGRLSKTDFSANSAPIRITPGHPLWEYWKKCEGVPSWLEWDIVPDPEHRDQCIAGWVWQGMSPDKAAKTYDAIKTYRCAAWMPNDHTAYQIMQRPDGRISCFTEARVKELRRIHGPPLSLEAELEDGAELEKSNRLAFIVAMSESEPRHREESTRSLAEFIPPVLRDKSRREPPLLTAVYLRGHQVTKEGEHSLIDKSGKRLHWVDPFLREFRPGEFTPVRGHWRGDSERGIVRKLYVAKDVK